MPTPVRVRGKKGNKRQAVESSRRTRAQNASAKTSSPRERPLSILERFPVEILQDIFVLSTNLNLPLVSSALLAKLDCEHVKRRIVISAFAHGEVTEHTLQCGECCGAEAWLEDTYEDSVFQTSVMRRRWFTYAFFEKCRETFFQQQAKRAVDYFERNYCDKKRKNVAAELKNFLSRRPIRDKQTDDLPNYIYIAFPDAEEGPTLDIQFSQLSSDGRPLGLMVYVDVEDDAVGPRSKSYLARRQALSLELRMPFVCTDAMIPKRLLRGPWTDEKLQLLKMILEGSESRADLFEAYEEVLPQFDPTNASKGLEEAIREYCVPAMAMLAKPRWDEWYVEFYINARGITEGDMRAAPLELEKYCKSKVEVDTGLFHDLHGTQLGVTVCEKHLITALEAAEKHGDSEAGVYTWLLPLAILQQYDEYRMDGTKDMYSLVEWIIRKKIDEEARGIKQGLGAKALKKLDEEQHFVRTLFRDFVLDTAP